MKTKNFGLINFAAGLAGRERESEPKQRLNGLQMTGRVIALAGLLSFGISNAKADLEVSASVQIHAKADFYSPLNAHGGWVEVGSYGHCWHPANVAVGWRPYCYGHWVWTDCGWYWDSDEPWAWACYHYGYWVFDPVYGWVWVPEVEWAPSWVCWRVGGGYIGWAPMAPPGIVFASHPEPSLFVFVNTEHFADPIRPTGVIVNNVAIAKKTSEINEVKRETRALGGGAPQRVVINKGPSVEMVQKATGKSLQVTPIREVAGRAAMPASFKKNGPSPAKEVHNTGGQQPKGFNSPQGPSDGPSKGDPWSRGGDERGRDGEHGHGHGHGW